MAVYGVVGVDNEISIRAKWGGRPLALPSSTWVGGSGTLCERHLALGARTRHSGDESLHELERRHDNVRGSIAKRYLQPVDDLAAVGQCKAIIGSEY